MKKTAPDGAVSGMPAIRETGPGKNLQAITVSTKHRSKLPAGEGSPGFPKMLGIAGGDTRHARNSWSRPGLAPRSRYFLFF